MPTKEVDLPVTGMAWRAIRRAEVMLDDLLLFIETFFSHTLYIIASAFMLFLGVLTLLLFFYGALLFLPEGKIEGLVLLFVPIAVLFLLLKDFQYFVDSRKLRAAKKRREDHPQVQIIKNKKR